MPAVKVDKISKNFNGVRALEGVSLTVEKGKIVGLIGPDGAGKTTFLRLLMGLLQPSSGMIQIEGLDVKQEPQRIKDWVGYMPQHFSLYGDLTVAENLRFFSDLYGVPKTHFQQRKAELLGFSGLAPFEKRLARNLSGGMQKKLALASNLFHTPRILLLDEPTTGVDPVSRKELWEILLALNKQGVTLIITTPYMDEAQKCQMVGLLHAGRILRFAPPQTIIQEYENEVFELSADFKNITILKQNLGGLKTIYPFGDVLHLIFEKGREGEKTTRQLLQKRGIQFQNLRKIEPSLEDIFLTLVTK